MKCFSELSALVWYYYFDYIQQFEKHEVKSRACCVK